MEQQYELKYIIIGCSGVGKSSILKRLVDNDFSTKTLSTVGIEFSSYEVKFDQYKIIYNIWDTAGQEKFYAIARSYFRNAVGIILVFDISDRASFEKLSKWLNDARAEGNPQAVVMLVGNKIDLIEKRQVTSEDAQAYAQSNDLIYIESSASEGRNIEQIFLQSGKEIVSKIQSGQINYHDLKVKSIPRFDLHDEEEEAIDSQKKRCC